MEVQKHTLYLKSIICTKRIQLDQILTYIQKKYDTMILGFAPCLEDTFMFVSQIYDGEDDYRLFIYGEELENIKTKKLYFPEFSHA